MLVRGVKTVMLLLCSECGLELSFIRRVSVCVPRMGFARRAAFRVQKINARSGRNLFFLASEHELAEVRAAWQWYNNYAEHRCGTKKILKACALI